MVAVGVVTIAVVDVVVGAGSTLELAVGTPVDLAQAEKTSEAATAMTAKVELTRLYFLAQGPRRHPFTETSFMADPSFFSVQLSRSQCQAHTNRKAWQP